MAKDPVCGMEVDESTNLKLKVGGETYYFCSEYCLRKLAKEKGVPEQEVQGCFSCAAAKTRWYKDRLFIISAALSFFLGLSYFVKFLEPFRKSFFMYAGTLWWAIFLGLALGGVIDYLVPREYISKVLSKPKKITVIYSVAFGFLMSVCSHGILAISMELYKKGASVPAVISFLLASPWANFSITLMLLSLFGLKGIYIIICAIIIAVLTGVIFQFLDRKNLIEKNSNMIRVDDSFSIREDIIRRMKGYKPGIARAREDFKGIVSGAIALSNMVLWWILIGIVLASLTGAYIPAHIFREYMGPSLLGLFVTLALAAVLEVCSEGTAPLAFEIFKQTGAFGNSFVFLMAGVVTDYTEIGLLWSNIGRKTAVWMPLVTVPQVILFGIIANLVIK